MNRSLTYKCVSTNIIVEHFFSYESCMIRVYNYRYAYDSKEIMIYEYANTKFIQNNQYFFIMLSVKLKLSPSTIDGKECSLYYQLIYKRTVRQVRIPFKIFEYEWDNDSELIKNNNTINRKCYLESVIWFVKSDMERFQNIYKIYAESNKPFSIDDIVQQFSIATSGLTLFIYIERIISQYLKKGQYRTSETYSTTLNSFRRYRGNIDLALSDLNSDIIEAYEQYLLKNDLSPNTVLFYLKKLRSVYNRAIDEELIIDKRPFKRISTTEKKTAKRAISLNTIKHLKSLDLNNCPSKAFARDMFLFSFYTRGMSFVDIAYLQKKNLKNDELCYRRKKTNQSLCIHWENCMQEILEKYETTSQSPYLFSIINNQSIDSRKQYLNALYKINRSLKIIGNEIGLNQPLTMYCARHSWASIARDEGVPLSVISEGMGHDSEKTTLVYLASLKTEVIDTANRKILNLLLWVMQIIFLLQLG